MNNQQAASAPTFVDLINAAYRWPLRRWVVAVAGAVVAALLIGVPTAIVSTPFFARMTPTLWWNYPVWAATSILSGLTVATYVRPAADNTARAGGMTGGGLLSALAVGCPICNKLVVAALGLTGAVTIWAPIQPLLGVAGLVLLIFALRARLRGEVACPVPVGRLKVDARSHAGQPPVDIQ